MLVGSAVPPDCSSAELVVAQYTMYCLACSSHSASGAHAMAAWVLPLPAGMRDATSVRYGVDQFTKSVDSHTTRFNEPL